MEKNGERQFRLAPLRVNKFIKANDLVPVSNPIFFTKNNSPTPDGLLSNEIFGITKDERANIFSYIELGKNEVFMHPLHYKIWKKIDSKVTEVVHGLKKFSIDSDGQFIEDENGSNGVKFIKNNIDKIKFRSTDSDKRDRNIKFLKDNIDTMFIENMIVIPAYYRDVNTNGGYVGVGEINKIYNSLMIAVRALNDSVDYGLTLSNSIRGRIQEIILQIYVWFGTEPNIPKKRGILRRANNSKTTDYSSRLIISAPELKVENLEDLVVDLDYSAVPLASACVNFFPFIITWVRRFFENEFAGIGTYKYIEKGVIKTTRVKDYLIQFSDDRIKKELDRFIFGYSNRFIPIKVENEDKKEIYMTFKGYNMSEQDYLKASQNKTGELLPLNRRLTWCDIFYMAAIDVTKDKVVLITRYPIDSFYNQFPTKIRVSSTKETEPMIINDKFIKAYPRIREEDIEKNTSNKFVDTLQICNAYLGSIGGDYDGDQVSNKGIFTIEANAELMEQINSKSHYISLGGTNIMTTTNEGMQSLYNLTLVLPGTKIDEPEF